MMRNFQIRYRQKKQLGVGSFGKVYLARDSKKNCDCVIKVIDISSMSKNEEENA